MNIASTTWHLGHVTFVDVDGSTMTAGFRDDGELYVCITASDDELDIHESDIVLNERQTHALQDLLGDKL